MSRAHHAVVLFLALLFSGLGACGESSNATGDGAVAADQEATEPDQQTAPDLPAAGGRVWTEISADEVGWTAQLWSAELGEVFGVALRVQYDPKQLELAEASTAEPLGDVAGGTALYLVTSRPGEVTLGGARQGPAQGGVDLTLPTLLGTLTLRSLQEGQPQLTLSQVMVRRLDGSFVPTTSRGSSMQRSGEQR